MMNEGMAITAKMQVKYKSTRSGKSGERVNTATKSIALPPTDYDAPMMIKINIKGTNPA